ncbi:MAG: serine--tRNA ligase [Patescibacteria group bacterium]
MLDIKLIRENPDEVREGLKKRNKDPKLVDDFLAADEKWRALTRKLDEARFQQAEFSKARKIDEAKKNKEGIKLDEAELRNLENKRELFLEQLPNIPADDVPAGKNELENVILREVGEKRKFDFQPKEYLEIAEKLDIIDVQRAAKVSGSRFGYLKGKAALLELALIQFAMKKIAAKGFVPIIPPVMIKPEPYAGMGRLAGDQKEERYFLEKDGLYLVGSAEHTIGPLHMDEVLREEELPKRYVGFSTCFRREAGSYGKDTKGILRVHQFDKVEMFSFTKPENSEEEHKFLLSIQEELMQDLKLPYRVMQICAGDMGWVDYKQYDVEVWLPGQNTYRETHSCSNTSDFQARGVNTKYGKDGKFVHMLNATGLAIGRIIIAIIENYQTKDGDFEIPEVLR